MPTHLQNAPAAGTAGPPHTAYGETAGPRPTARIVIGAYLRTLRQDENLTLIEAADMLDISPEHLGRTEWGRRPLSQAQLEQLIQRFPSCGPHEQRTLRGLLAPTRTQFVGRGADPDMVLDCATGWAARLQACERQAATIVTYSAGLVPAILRTDAYSEVFCADALTEQQRRLSPARALPRGHGKVVLVLLDECGLHQCPRTVGHPGERTVQVLVCGQLISLSGMTICPSVGLRPTG